MDRGDRNAGRDEGPRPLRDAQAGPEAADPDDLLGDAGDDGRGSDERPRDEPPPFIGRGAFPDDVGEQAEFREQFDEDLYNDREDRPAQGNTADVAMGDHRFGSEADAYTEYAWRRPGDHHRGDESAVGQARDPADIADEDERP